MPTIDVFRPGPINPIMPETRISELDGLRAVAVLMVTVGLGLSTVTLWTPYPARRPGERRDATPWDEAAVVISDTAEGAAGETGPQAYQVTDEMIARLLEDPSPGPRRHPIRPNPAMLVPVAHGFAAIATFVLAVTAAST